MQFLPEVCPSRYNFRRLHEFASLARHSCWQLRRLIENAGVSAYITAESFLVLSPAPPFALRICTYVNQPLLDQANK
jgi:hypothetical protein